MTDGYRPGPLSIDPARCPDGVVIQVYNRDGALLLETSVSLHDDVQTRAEHDADLVVAMEPGDVCLVAFDGDTGERMTMRGGPVV